MTEQEVAGFLEDSMKVQVATLNPDGSPHLSTLFYVVLDGRIAFWTYRRSQKLRNLERDQRVGCLVESGADYLELRGVSLTGTATIVQERDQVMRIGSAVAERMAGGADLGDMGRAEVQRQAEKRVAVLVSADRVACWDLAKLVATSQDATSQRGPG